MQIFHKSISEQAANLDQATRSKIEMKNKRATQMKIDYLINQRTENTRASPDQKNYMRKYK